MAEVDDRDDAAAGAGRETSRRRTTSRSARARAGSCAAAGRSAGPDAEFLHQVEVAPPVAVVPHFSISSMRTLPPSMVGMLFSIPVAKMNPSARPAAQDDAAYGGDRAAGQRGSQLRLAAGTAGVDRSRRRRRNKRTPRRRRRSRSRRMRMLPPWRVPMPSAPAQQARPKSEAKRVASASGRAGAGGGTGSRRLSAGRAARWRRQRCR
jgi:hypothetical protein